ncbi:MAG TPA: FRG domain-containing protein [Candidatus Eisenbacteria bacterium]|nr:FRG domain-containing protein [Candidatus Eisenbacteria bacterium]
MEKLRSKLVSSWDGLCAEVKHAAKRLKLEKDEELWYRGVSDCNFVLMPSLLRCFGKSKPTVKALRNLENDLFFEFMAKARLEGGESLSEWDVLFLMQHYRAPTRLLDWTEVLQVAVYFAVAYRKRDPADPARIYVTNPYVWNDEHGYGRDLYWPRYFGWDAKTKAYYDFGEILVDEAYIDWKYPCALYPPQRDVRLSAQRGFFTIHGYDLRPMDEISPEFVEAIDLDHSAIEECKHQLRYSGIDEYSLFPDLEGLSRKLRKDHGLDLPLPG